MTLDERLTEIEALMSEMVNSFKPFTQAELKATREEIFNALRIINNTLKQLETTVEIIEKRIGD